MATQLQLGLKFREGYSVPVREELDQLVASLNAQVPASISSAIAAIPLPTPLGEWTVVPFSAANFTWATLTAGQLANSRYTVIGKTVFWQLAILSAPGPTVASPYLYCVIPYGVMPSVAPSVAGSVAINEAGVGLVGYAVWGNQSQIAVTKATGVNFGTPVSFATTFIYQIV